MARLNIPGTKLDISSAQLLISTGIPALDDLLGGGLPIGGVVLIDEDTFGSYSKALLKYFLVEGVVNSHNIFVASLDCDPKSEIVEELPKLNETDSDVETKAPYPESKMTIAFRYQNLPTQEKAQSSAFGHYYDLSKRLSQDQLNADKITYFTGHEGEKEERILENRNYNNLLMRIKNKALEDRFRIDGRLENKSVLRVCLHQLASPLWDEGSNYEDLRRFVYYLKCLMRKTFGVAVISVPSHLSAKLKDATSHLVHTCDIALRLEAFAGTKLERNKYLSEYHGFFYITKLAAINTLVSKHPGAVEYVFQLRKKKMVIKMLHLPPDIEEDLKKTEQVPKMSCSFSGGGARNLDF